MIEAVVPLEKVLDHGDLSIETSHPRGAPVLPVEAIVCAIKSPSHGLSGFDILEYLASPPIVGLCGEIDGEWGMLSSRVALTSLSSVQREMHRHPFSRFTKHLYSNNLHSTGFKNDAHIIWV